MVAWVVFFRIYSSQALTVRSLHLGNAGLVHSLARYLAVANLSEKLSVVYTMDRQFISVNGFNSNCIYYKLYLDEYASLSWTWILNLSARNICSLFIHEGNNLKNKTSIILEVNNFWRKKNKVSNNKKLNSTFFQLSQQFLSHIPSQISSSN